MTTSIPLHDLSQHTDPVRQEERMRRIEEIFKCENPGNVQGTRVFLWNASEMTLNFKPASL
jgi:hypothetical protein